MYDNGNIIIDREMQTYNPYFNIDVLSLDFIDNVAMISYHEKHCVCSVKIIPNEKKHNIYLKSKPNTFSRSQNENIKDHDIGEIIEFIKNDVIMENKTYFA